MNNLKEYYKSILEDFDIDLLQGYNMRFAIDPASLNIVIYFKYNSCHFSMVESTKYIWLDAGVNNEYNQEIVDFIYNKLQILENYEYNLSCNFIQQKEIYKLHDGKIFEELNEEEQTILKLRYV